MYSLEGLIEYQSQSSNYVHSYKFRRRWNIIICLYLYVIDQQYRIIISQWCCLGNVPFLSENEQHVTTLFAITLSQTSVLSHFRVSPHTEFMIIVKFDVMVQSIYDCDSIYVHSARKIQTMKYNLISEMKKLYYISGQIFFSIIHGSMNIYWIFDVFLTDTQQTSSSLYLILPHCNTRQYKL